MQCKLLNILDNMQCLKILDNMQSKISKILDKMQCKILKILDNMQRKMSEYPLHINSLCAGPQVTTPLPSGQTPPTPLPTPAPYVSPVTLSPTEGPPEVCVHGWTPLINSDNPRGPDGGDIESFERLRNTAHFCDNSNIIAIECVDLSTSKRAEDSGQTVTCSKETGFTCIDAEQTEGVCYDYGVRFFCHCYNNCKYSVCERLDFILTVWRNKIAYPYF